MPSIKGFHHTAIRSSHFDESVGFYTEVLGLKVKITWGEGSSRAAMIDAGDGNYVEIFERSAFEPAESTILHFALRTDDCVGMTEIVRAAGRPITMEPNELEIGSNKGPIPVKVSFFTGPDGEVVELFENRVL